jgi:hypothetical protein
MAIQNKKPPWLAGVASFMLLEKNCGENHVTGSRGIFSLLSQIAAGGSA